MLGVGLEDKILGISEEEAQKNLRFAFCLTLPSPQDDITNYFRDQIRKQRGLEAANRIKELVEASKELNGELSNPTTVGETN